MRHGFVTGTIVLAVLVAAGCTTTGNPAAEGAVLGGALGAGTGAIIGHQSGHGGEGAAIGAGLGALTGAIMGDAVRQNRRPVGQQQVQRPLPPPEPAAPYGSGGHYENRIVQTPSGGTYEERVWVSNP